MRQPSTYKVRWDKRAYRQLMELPRDIQERITEKVLALKNDPRSQGKPLAGGFKGAYRLRVGDYRVVFEVEEKPSRTVWLTRVGDRKNIY